MAYCEAHERYNCGCLESLGMTGCPTCGGEDCFGHAPEEIAEFEAAYDQEMEARA